jgi:predicted MFS family arabinose efflux permease
MAAILKLPNSWVAIALITAMMSIFAFTPFVSPFLVQIVGISEADLPTVYMFAGAASFIVSPLIGRLSDRFGARRIFISSSVVAVPAMLLFSNLQKTSLTVAVAMNTLVAAVGAARMTPSLALINGSVSSELRGRFMTLIASVQQFSAAFASFIGGLLLGDTADSLSRFPVLGGIVATSMVISSLLSLLIKTDSQISSRTVD